MGSQTAIILAIISAYLGVIIAIGVYSTRFSRRTMEDYHMGSREFGALVLFSAVFGANISAVAFIGIPGQAYHVGWIAGPYFITCQAWLAPLLFYVVGSRAWALGKRHGLMTQAEVVSARWQSPGLGMLISIVIVIYTIPYLMIGLRGAGLTLAALTDGFIPFWVGALLVASIVLVYLVLGGMRGAAWVNVLQSAVFIIGGLIIFGAVAAVLGGPTEATRRVYEDYPELISRTTMSWQQFFSYGFIVSLANPMFPQLFMRLLTGRDPKSLKQTLRIYPLAVFIVVFLMATLGMWGRPVVPGLEGAASDAILPTLLAQYTPVWVTGVLGAAVVAAMMSTMDSQLLSVTTIVMRDFLYRTKLRLSSEDSLVRLSRGLMIAITAAAYALALVNPYAVIAVVEFAFAGFACLLAPTLGALYWKRCTARAAVASIVISQATLIGLTTGVIDQRLAFGFLPGLPALIVGLVVLLAVGHMPAEDSSRNAEYLKAATGQ
jgi:SSS family solute:Na+ symporter